MIKTNYCYKNYFIKIEKTLVWIQLDLVTVSWLFKWNISTWLPKPTFRRAGSRSVALPWMDALLVSVRPLLTDFFFSHLRLGALLSLQAGTAFSATRSRSRDGETDKGRDLIKSLSQHLRHRVVVTEQSLLGGKLMKTGKVSKAPVHFLLFMLFFWQMRVLEHVFPQCFFSLCDALTPVWWWLHQYVKTICELFLHILFWGKIWPRNLTSCYSPHGLHLLVNKSSVANSLVRKVGCPKSRQKSLNDVIT